MLVVAWALMPSPGCTGREAAPLAQPVFDTVGMTIHVRNPADGLWERGEPWRVREVLRLGAANAPPEELFSGPLLTTGLGPDGRIYVLDSDAERISVFSKDGEFERYLGGSGRGPGEFSAPSALTWDGFGRLWVADGFGGRYSVFTSDGDFLRTERRPVSRLARRQHPLLYDDGWILDEASMSPRMLFIAVDTIGTAVDTLGSFTRPPLPSAPAGHRIRPGSAVQDYVRNYIARARWAIAPDRTLWMSHNHELRLIQRTLAGDTLRVIHTTHRPAALSRSDRRLIGEAAAELEVPEDQLQAVRPLVQSLHVLGDGTLLVQIVDDVGQDSPIFDVFDPEGRFMGTLDLGFAPTPLGVTSTLGDTIVAPIIGAWDVPYVVMAVIERGADDT